MCYAALRWAKLRRLCFAATRYDAAAPGVDFSDLVLYEEMAEPYTRRAFSVCQCTVGNALDAFNLWKRSEKTPY